MIGEKATIRGEYARAKSVLEKRFEGLIFRMRSWLRLGIVIVNSFGFTSLCSLPTQTVDLFYVYRLEEDGSPF